MEFAVIPSWNYGLGHSMPIFVNPEISQIRPAIIIKMLYGRFIMGLINQNLHLCALNF
jgi:hypothetical protein